MSIILKNWFPREGCDECKEAEKIQESMERINANTVGKALNKIKIQHERIEELKAAIREHNISVCLQKKAWRRSDDYKLWSVLKDKS